METPALTVNRLCGSGFQSVINGAQVSTFGVFKDKRTWIIVLMVTASCRSYRMPRQKNTKL